MFARLHSFSSIIFNHKDITQYMYTARSCLSDGNGAGYCKWGIDQRGTDKKISIYSNNKSFLGSEWLNMSN